MVNKIYLILILVLFLILINYIKKKEKFTTQNHFLIVVAFYNPGELYLEKCLKSILNQDYKNYKVCLVNDKSTTEVKEIEDLCQKFKKNYGWKYIVNEANKGPCYSRIEGIKLLNPKDEDIIVLVDGDDKLHNDKVLTKLNNHYQDKTQITFGNFIRVNKKGRFRKSSIKCHKYNINKMAERKNFRNLGGYPFSHLKTFKYKLYKNLNLDDLKKNGEYIRSSTDAAVMFPLLEMAGNNIKCIDDILYDYTIDHNESFHNNFEKKKNAD